MAETREERKERTRRAILDAALELCEDSSLVALSLRQVAKQVGIVPTAFYRHFESIEQLGLALVEESFATLRALLRDLRRRRDVDVRALIDDSIEVLVERVRADRDHFAFITRERFAGPPAVRQEIERQIELFERELATDLSHLPGTADWADDDLRALSGLIVSSLVSTAEAIIAADARTDLERRVVETARTQLRMVLVGANNWRSRR